MNIASDIVTISALRTWHAALAGRQYGPAVIAAIGSCASEGYEVSKYGNGFVSQLATALRARFPVARPAGDDEFVGIRRRHLQAPLTDRVAAVGENYLPTWSNMELRFDWPVWQNGGYATEDFGWALRLSVLNGAQQAITGAFSGTSVRLWYATQPGGGTFSITIDQLVVAASLNTDSAAKNYAATWTSAALTPGPHEVVVTCLSAGSSGVRVQGFAIFDGDERQGIHLYNGACGHYGASDFVYYADGWAPRLSTLQPHLVLIELGVEDWANGHNLAAIKTSFKSLIARVRASCTTKPSFVLVGSPQANTEPQSQDYAVVLQALREVTTEDTGGYAGASGVAYFDLSARQLAPVFDNSLQLYQDSGNDLMYPTDQGAAHIADALTAFLSPA